MVAGEGDDPLGGAIVAADAGEAMGQDPAPVLGPEVLLPPRHTLAPWVGPGGPGQERLEVVLDAGVEGVAVGRRRRSTAAWPAGAVECGSR